MLIYDCEIIKCIPNKLRDKIHPDSASSDIQFCGGWDDFDNMGISVIGAYVDQSSFADGYHSFINPDDSIPYDFPTFQQLLTLHSVVVGFNSRSFDDFLCRSNGISVTTTYDLLHEIRIAAGFDIDYRSVPRSYSYSLDSVAKANGLAKSGSGALAPQLWQKGLKDEVVTYCLHDVYITRCLLELGLSGSLIDPNTQKFLHLRPLS